MISYENAKQIVQDAGRRCSLASESVALNACVGRVCSQDIFAPIDIQPFDNSAMDGYAVRIADLETASEGQPVMLTLEGMVAAGDTVPTQGPSAGACIEIMTGAPTPPQADAVVPVELTSKQNEGRITFSEMPSQGANIRCAGEDFQAGQLVLKKGTRIKPQHVMPLATLGVATLEVFSKPKAVFLSTGSELVDDLSQDLKPGQIYNSNRSYGLASLAHMGLDCHEIPHLPDDVDGFVALLEGWMEQGFDFIISSGAVSMGRFDFVRAGLEAIGAEILFHKVKMRPGKPILFARLPNGMLYFGLPGNPVATATGLRFFVRPCLDAALCEEAEKPLYAKVENSFQKKAGMRMFLKGDAGCDARGQFSVRIMEGQQSFRVSPFADMNAWVVAPADSEQLKTGDYVEIHPFDRSQFEL